MNKSIALAVVIYISPVVAIATTIDGIEIGSGSFSFVATTVMGRVNNINNNSTKYVGDVLGGVGRVTEIFSESDSVWQNGVNNRELTFVFDNYVASYVSSTVIEYTGGSVKFYNDDTADSNYRTGTGFADGTVWLDLSSTSFVSDLGHVVSLVSTGTLLGTKIAGTNVGLLSVTGFGAADTFFDTNAFIAYGTNYTADWDFTSSFSNRAAPSFVYGTVGTTNLNGVQTVPEPSSLALFGIALVGFGLAYKRN